MFAGQYFPKVLKTTKMPMKTWAALRTERMTTVLNHVRRVVRSKKRLEEMMGKMLPDDFDQLREKVLSKAILIDSDDETTDEAVEKVAELQLLRDIQKDGLASFADTKKGRFDDLAAAAHAVTTKKKAPATKVTSVAAPALATTVPS